MTKANPWRIQADSPDWECTWQADALFHLRYFRSLPLREKIRALEEMEKVAALFVKSDSRRQQPKSGFGDRRMD